MATPSRPGTRLPANMPVPIVQRQISNSDEDQNLTENSINDDYDYPSPSFARENEKTVLERNDDNTEHSGFLIYFSNKNTLTKNDVYG